MSDQIRAMQDIERDEQLLAVVGKWNSHAEICMELAAMSTIETVKLEHLLRADLITKLMTDLLDVLKANGTTDNDLLAVTAYVNAVRANAQQNLIPPDNNPIQ